MLTLKPTGGDSSWRRDVFFLTIIFAVLFFTLLGVRPLFVPDEGRYAEIAREMVSLNDYITPHLNHIKYFEKPALFYWLGAIAIKLGGTHLAAIRSVNALLALFGCLITYFTTRRLYDRETGFLAALVLGTSTLYFVMTHMVSLDLPVTVFLMGTLYAFLLATENSTKSRLWMWTAAASAALAVLTKGLIGIVFPCLIVASWLTLTGKWRLIKTLSIPSSIILFLLIAAPWHILVGLRNPEFFSFYFIEQHILRYTNMEVGHYQPVWFFIPTLIIGFMPWIVFLPQSIKQVLTTPKQNRQSSANLFFLLWSIIVFAFFSFSKSKLIPYILPVIPPLAILTAHYLVTTCRKQHYLGIQIGCALLAVIGVAATCVFYAFTANAELPDPTFARVYLLLAGTVLALGALISLYYAVKREATVLKSLVLTASFFLLAILVSMPSIDARTIKPLAAIIQTMVQPDDEIVAFHQYYQDLPFYLQKRVTIISWQNELTYGLEHQDAHEWMINDQTFWKRWHSQHRLFVIMSLDEYDQLLQQHPKEKVILLGKTLKNALISNSN